MQWKLHTVFLYQFLVFGLTRRGIEPESTVLVANALSTRPQIGVLLFTGLIKSKVAVALCPWLVVYLAISILNFVFRGLLSCSPFGAMWRFLSVDWNRSAKILGIGLCFFLQLTIHDGTGDVVVIYELSKPLCWTSLLIG